MKDYHVFIKASNGEVTFIAIRAANFYAAIDNAEQATILDEEIVGIVELVGGKSTYLLAPGYMDAARQQNELPFDRTTLEAFEEERF